MTCDEIGLVIISSSSNWLVACIQIHTHTTIWCPYMCLFCSLCVETGFPSCVLLTLKTRCSYECCYVEHRFHQLSEFDEAKRSCCRSLAGHNERRRAPAESQEEGSSHQGMGKPPKRSHLQPFPFQIR